MELVAITSAVIAESSLDGRRIIRHYQKGLPQIVREVYLGFLPMLSDEDIERLREDREFGEYAEWIG